MKWLGVGDYVLGLKYRDGGALDHWCVGFYVGKLEDRYLVADGDGKLFRADGFRRVVKVSRKRGAAILANKGYIELGGRSLLWWARQPFDSYPVQKFQSDSQYHSTRANAQEVEGE